MRERPIIFSGEMVRAILDGRKTQTRRVINPQPTHELQDDSTPDCGHYEWEWCGKLLHPSLCPYGKAGGGIYNKSGDRLYVKERWALDKKYDKFPGSKVPKKGRGRIFYFADGEKPEWAGRSRAARFMPRWASRILVEITNVRWQQLQEISEKDARAEGVKSFEDLQLTWRDYQLKSYAPLHTARDSFKSLWDSINAKRGQGWDKNLWVWPITFEQIKERGRNEPVEY